MGRLFYSIIEVVLLVRSIVLILKIWNNVTKYAMLDMFSYTQS